MKNREIIDELLNTIHWIEGMALTNEIHILKMIEALEKTILILKSNN